MKHAKKTIKSNHIIVGRNPVLESLKGGIEIEKVYIQIGVRGEFEKEIRKLCKEDDVPLVTVPKEKLNAFFRGNHQGIVALSSVVKYHKLEHILPKAYEDSEQPLFVMLDNVTDIRNFGAIARSAEVFGAHALIISKKGGALINEEAVKTSAGAVMKIPICREKSLGITVDYLRDSGVKVVCADLQGNKYIQESDLSGPVCIVMGAEGRGINPDLLQKLPDRFKIPQFGETDSLNVSVAAGIILYEIKRQRNFI
jgi:23S rRNA (guanosine2251-2'-O)-methyltransferase